MMCNLSLPYFFQPGRHKLLFACKISKDNRWKKGAFKEIRNLTQSRKETKLVSHRGATNSCYNKTSHLRLLLFLWHNMQYIFHKTAVEASYYGCIMTEKKWISLHDFPFYNSVFLPKSKGTWKTHRTLRLQSPNCPLWNIIKPVFS